MKIRFFLSALPLLIGCSRNVNDIYHPIEEATPDYLDNDFTYEQSPPIDYNENLDDALDTSYKVLEIDSPYDFGNLRFGLVHSGIGVRYNVLTSIPRNELTESYLFHLTSYVRHAFPDLIDSNEGEFIGGLSVDLQNGNEIYVHMLDQLWWGIHYREVARYVEFYPHLPSDWWTIAHGLLNIHTLETERWRIIGEDRYVIESADSPF